MSSHYSWPPGRDQTFPVGIKLIDPEGNRHPGNYVPHPELVHAVNLALLLGRPLLLTGEPGTGKTELAYSLAFQLGLAGPFCFVAKSTSLSRDLFYTYDVVSRFHAVETARLLSDEGARLAAKDPLNYVRYEALGRAILLALPAEQAAPFFPALRVPPELRSDALPQRSVVLIDEIDKAPRDFPNDILADILEMRFRIPEMLGEYITPPIPDRSMWPVVIITSNSERQLPDAFLRRCIYFDIPFPARKNDAAARAAGEVTDEYNIEEIIVNRLGANFVNAPLTAAAIELFYLLRESRPPLIKRPATAELLNWLAVLRAAEALPGHSFSALIDASVQALPCMLKTSDDLVKGRQIVKHWADLQRGRP